MAVAGLVLGIISIVFAFIPAYPITSVIAIICGIVGIILCAIALKKDAEKKGMKITGLVLSIVGLVVSIITLIACVACVSAATQVANDPATAAAIEQSVNDSLNEVVAEAQAQQ